MEFGSLMQLKEGLYYFLLISLSSLDNFSVNPGVVAFIFPFNTSERFSEGLEITMIFKSKHSSEMLPKQSSIMCFICYQLIACIHFVIHGLHYPMLLISSTAEQDLNQ